jgi:hypothetical protein
LCFALGGLSQKSVSVASEKSLAWIRAFVFFVRKLCRIPLSSGLCGEATLICPNYRYFKRFGLVPLRV